MVAEWQRIKIATQGVKPFRVEWQARSWGLQPCLIDKDDRNYGYVCLSGSSKQRRQQARKLLRELNK